MRSEGKYSDTPHMEVRYCGVHRPEDICLDILRL